MHTRPENFDGVRGQDLIKKVLKASLSKNNVAPAYLFSGIRGTGKTTLARILAMSLNCKDPDPNPCGSCSNCTAIKKGAYPDFIEIDGAANNSVDDVRDLIQTVQYKPFGKKRIIIIDECHMLSASAQNALLKTLEEPPRHTVFVLCTTDAPKLLDTVISRCHHFELRPIKEDVILETLKDTVDKENIKADTDALRLIARFGNGSMRDALSILSKLKALPSITRSTILDSEGYLSAKDSAPWVVAVLTNDYKKLLELTSDSSFDPFALTQAILSLLKDILEYNLTKECTGLTPLVTVEWFYKNIPRASDSKFILGIMTTLSTMPKNLASPKAWLEVQLLSLCS